MGCDESIQLLTGVIQGGASSPRIFMVFINALLEHLACTGQALGISPGIEETKQFNTGGHGEQEVVPLVGYPGRQKQLSEEVSATLSVAPPGDCRNVWHELHSVMLVLSAHVCRGQSMQDELQLMPLYLPNSHATQGPPLGPEYPGIQIQSSILALCALLVVSAGQSWQSSRSSV